MRPEGTYFCELIFYTRIYFGASSLLYTAPIFTMYICREDVLNLAWVWNSRSSSFGSALERGPPRITGMSQSITFP